MFVDVSRYDHLVAITRDRELTERYLNAQKVVDTWEFGSEVPIPSLPLTTSRGTTVYIYGRGLDLESLFLHCECKLAGIVTLGAFPGSSQCFFDHERRRNKDFQSRGLFRATTTATTSLEYVGRDDDVFPSTYRVRIFAIDGGGGPFSGASIWDVKVVDEGCLLADDEPHRVEVDDGDEVRALTELFAVLGAVGPIALLGYGTDKMCTRLFQRVALHGLLPLASSAALVESCGRLSECAGHRLFFPPWLMYVDLQTFTRRFFPHDRHVEPPYDDEPYVCARNLGLDPARDPYPRLITKMALELDALRLTFALGRLADAGPEICLRPSRTVVARRLYGNWARSVFGTPEEKKKKHHHHPLTSPHAGGKVLEPQTGVWTSNDDHVIEAWDFKAFYPSLIHGFNLQTGFVAQVDATEVNDDDYHVLDGGAGVRYVSLGTGHVPLARLCEHFMGVRDRASPAMGRAIKFILNSLYGMSERIARTAIAGYGRTCLDLAVESAQAIGAHILYGDTDSIFVRVRRDAATGLREEFERRKEAHWGARCPPLVILRRERRFDVLVLCTKKKYAGLTDDGGVMWCGLMPRRMTKEAHSSVRELFARLLQRPSPPTIREWVYEWFAQQVEKEEAAATVRPKTTKVRASRSYERRHVPHYPLSVQCERLRGKPLEETTTVQFHSRLIPLIPQQRRRRGDDVVCLVEAFDPSLQRVDHSERVVRDYGPGRLGAFLRILLNDNGNHLEQCRETYLHTQRLAAYERYEERGYRVYDLSTVSSSLPSVPIFASSPWARSPWGEGYLFSTWMETKGHNHVIILEVHFHHTGFEMDGRQYSNAEQIKKVFPRPLRPHLRLRVINEVDVDDFDDVSTLCRLMVGGPLPPPPPPNVRPASWLVVLPDIALRRDGPERGTYFSLI